ncbi:MAG: hypothetical protein ABI592_01255 [Acidobacteriota bacterium]
MSTERSAPVPELECRQCGRTISTSELMEVFVFREEGGASPRPDSSSTFHYPKCSRAFESGLAPSERSRSRRWYGRRPA